MPKCFKDMYPTTRVIIDSTEIFTEMPTSYRSQSATFSNYKHHNTAKGYLELHQVELSRLFQIYTQGDVAIKR